MKCKLHRIVLCAMCFSSYCVQAAENEIEEVIVIAHPLSGEGLAQPTDVLSGEELQRKTTASIGGTLAREPGIHDSQFGVAVGRPVIHGLGGPRVRVMEDRIDTLDVSVTSADHVVSVEPYIADRIEVIKGPSTLLYGSGAIGGVVDVHTGRIPHASQEEGINGGIETRYDDNTEGTSVSGKLKGRSGAFAWHLDGTFKDGDDYEIPAFAESRQQMAAEALEEEEHEEEEGHEEEEEVPVRGTLPGSEFEFENYAGGVSYIGDWGFVGISISQTDADYGLPGGHHHEEGHDEEEGEEEHEEEVEGQPVLDLEQTRVDLELAVDNPFGLFESFNLRLGVNDYEHREIEPSGEVATLFENDAWEIRTELTYASDNWRGAFGIQHTDREFSAVGEEAFVPPVDSQDTAVFWVTETDIGAGELELGARFGEVSYDPSNNVDEDFNTYAASVGVVLPLENNWQFSAFTDYSVRAPVTEELYSNGPHLVTNAFEIGDPTLDEEKALNLSISLGYTSDKWRLSSTIYRTRFSDFIFEQATGAEEDGLPVFQFMQDDATFTGIDIEAVVRLADWEAGTFDLRGQFDWVDAEIDTSPTTDVPRIPPARYGIGGELRVGAFTATVDYYYVEEQDDVAPNELTTDRYDDIQIYLGYGIELANSTLDLFVSGKNLSDEEQRRHTSFIKDVAPAPGRTIEAGARLTF